MGSSLLRMKVSTTVTFWGLLWLTTVLTVTEPSSKLMANTQDPQAPLSGLMKILGQMPGGGGGAPPLSTSQASEMITATLQNLKDPELTFIQRMFKGDVNELDLLDHMMQSEGFKHLSNQPAAIRKLISAFPMMAMVPEMKALVDQELGDQDLITAFKAGMLKAASLMRSTVKTTADSDGVSNTMVDLMNDPNPDVQDMISAFNDGDTAAVLDLTDEVNRRLFPGMDTSVMQELVTPTGVMERMAKLYEQEDIMGVLTSDSTVADILKNPWDYFHFDDRPSTTISTS